MVIKKYAGGQKHKHKKCSICHQELEPGEYYLAESGGKHECRCNYCGSKKLKTIIEEMQLLHNELQKCGKNALEDTRGENGTTVSEVMPKGKTNEPERQESEPGENIPQFMAIMNGATSKRNLSYKQDVPILKKMPYNIILQIFVKARCYGQKYVNQEILVIYFDEIIKKLEAKRAEYNSKGALFTCMAYHELISVMKESSKEILKIK